MDPMASWVFVPSLVNDLWLTWMDAWHTFTVTSFDLVKWLYQMYAHLDSYSDPKLANWPLMKSPLGVLTILMFYYNLVFYGQQYLAWVEENERSLKSPKRIESGKDHHSHSSSHNHRHVDADNSSEAMMFAHQLIDALIKNPLFKWNLVVYNLGMCLLNAWISYELIHCGMQLNYNFLCQLVHTGTDNHFENRIAHALWWYFASKGVELLDTFFIVVRRKSNQLTFLHVYHHSTMFVVWWVGAKFVPGGSALSGAVVNAVVHVVMYGYYAACALGPAMRPYLWWKKYLTLLQLAQFTAGVSLGLSSIFTGCGFTRWMQYVFVAYAFSFLVLFGKFYIRTYSKCQDNQDKSQTPSADSSTESNSDDPGPNPTGRYGLCTTIVTTHTRRARKGDGDESKKAKPKTTILRKKHRVTFKGKSFFKQ